VIKQRPKIDPNASIRQKRMDMFDVLEGERVGRGAGGEGARGKRVCEGTRTGRREDDLNSKGWVGV
jgi:hypothetical protein